MCLALWPTGTHMLVCVCTCPPPPSFPAGPGDILDSQAPYDNTTPMISKTSHALPPTPPSVGMTPSLPVPDLDRSAISVAKSHISSGSTSSTVSLSGDYKDASGKVIRRYVCLSVSLSVCLPVCLAV